jgi:hypothetical protein
LTIPKGFLIISQTPPWCIGVLSARRRPQPMSTAGIARFRCARRSRPAETPRRSLPCSADSLLPTYTPRRLETFTRRCPRPCQGSKDQNPRLHTPNRRTAASLRLTSRLVVISRLVLICRLVFTNPVHLDEKPAFLQHSLPIGKWTICRLPCKSSVKLRHGCPGHARESVQINSFRMFYAQQCASRHRFLRSAEPDIHLQSRAPKSLHRRLSLCSLPVPKNS